MKLSDFLRSRGCVGKDHAMPRLDVASWLGISIREVKGYAEVERLAGVPIGYSTDPKKGGLYLCDGEQEVLDLLAKIERLALSLLRERSALKRKLRENREKRLQSHLW